MTRERPPASGPSQGADPQPRIDTALSDATARLEGRSASPRLDAELLLAHALGVARSHLFAHPERPLPAATARAYDRLVERRARGEPVAYLRGRCEFFGVTLTVDEAVLVPRPETEHLVEIALEHLTPTGRLLDLGTGSGAVALAVAAERPQAAVRGIERSAAALATAEGNRRRLGLEGVELRCGDWEAGIEGRFEVIAANPPYVEEDAPEWRDGGLQWEPREALAAGPDGLAALRRLVPAAAPALAPGGLLAVEHGAAQGEAVRRLLAAAGLEGVGTRTDLAGLERISYGRRAT